jgi:hypothetical protein
MPNQDLRRRAFVADNNYLVDKQNEDEKYPQEDHLDDEEQVHHMLQAFHAASTRNYGHRDDLPPPPKSWKEMMNHPKSAHFRAAAHKEMRALLSKDTWEEVQKSPQTKTLPTK